MALVLYLLIALSVGLATGEEATTNEQNAAPFSEASSSFTMELLKAASQKDQNLVASPIGISMLLSILHQGAKGATEEQLEKALHMSRDSSKEAYSSLITGLEGLEKVTLEWANGIYVNEEFEVAEDFKKAAQENFKANIEEFNASLPQETVERINGWVSESTHGKIKDLIDPDLLTSDTVMIMVNAIYFKGTWQNIFKKYVSQTRTFHKTEDSTTEAVFMRQENDLISGKDEKLGVKWLQLPYEDKQHAMLFVLPEEKNGLEKVMKEMTGEDLKRLMDSDESNYVHVTIPKFKLEWKSSLKSILGTLGLGDLFSFDTNLTGISASEQKLRLSAMVHQANIEVDEAGTTAAAATFNFIEVLSLVIHPDPFIFHADHPFLAFIIDKNNKIPLFAAKISDPTA